jgi:transposase
MMKRDDRRMKPLTLSEPEIIFGIQDEIRRAEEARYDHRLHAVLLVGQGMTCPQVAKKFGDGRGSVRNWVNRFEKYGFAGLVDGERCGRPPRLNEKELQEIGAALRRTPNEAGIAQNFWDGKTLSEFIKMKYKKIIRVRQCQRMFHKLGFRLRKPRPLVAFPDPAAREGLKKTSKNPEG